MKRMSSAWCLVVAAPLVLVACAAEQKAPETPASSPPSGKTDSSVLTEPAPGLGGAGTLGSGSVVTPTPSPAPAVGH